MVSSRGGLAIGEIIFYVPIMVVSVIICRKHSFRMSQGWIWISIMALARFIGSILTLASESDSSNTGLRSGVWVLSGAGLSPLILALIAFLKRVQDHMTERAASHTMFWFLGTLPLIGFVISIVSGVNLTSNNPETVDQGYTLGETVAVLTTATFGLCLLVVFWTSRTFSKISNQDKWLFYASAASVPFLIVRIVYAMLVAYNARAGESQFSYTSGSVLIFAFMARLQEMVVSAGYLSAGFVTPKESPFGELGDDMTLKERGSSREEDTVSSSQLNQGDPTRRTGTKNEP